MGTSATAMLWGTLKYEFRMQIRRKALWISMAVFGLWALNNSLQAWFVLAESPMSTAIANWAIATQSFLPIVFGVLMADRLPRDERLNVSELLETTPSPPWSRLLGKYLGAALATMAPIILVFGFGVGYGAVERGNLMAFPIAIAVFAAVMLPGLLFVAAFSIACPAIIWVPLYQFLFVGYWFWGNLLNPGFGIPTLNGTLLTPIGDNAAAGFFGIYPPYGGAASTWGGVASITILIVGAIAALFAVHRYLAWKRAQL